MPFSSLSFLLVFFPIAFAVYALVPKKARNFVLLAESLMFYAWGSFQYLWLIVLECVVGYLCGLAMEKYPRFKKPVLIACIAAVVAALVWFKYAGFVFGQLQAAGFLDNFALSIVLPAGISFYTFQILSYVIDVYRNKAPASHSFLSFSLYICMFFQLIAGPIVRYEQIQDQLVNHSLSWQSVSKGSSRFVCGLAKKLLIANSLSAFASAVFARETGIAAMWMAAAANLLFVYYDFSGYTDMAIGLACMMGYQLPENFRYPLIAGSFRDFWRRWHMSLTGWFRDYVYIPLGGSRHGMARTLLAMGVVWLLTGIWHGAGWTFIVWGLTFFVLLTLERFVLPKKLTASFVWRIVVLFGLILTFLLFQSPSLSEFIISLQRLFGMDHAGILTAQGLYLIRSYSLVLIIATAGSFPHLHQLYERLSHTMGWNLAFTAARALVLIICIAELAYGSWNPFLYFQF